MVNLIYKLYSLIIRYFSVFIPSSKARKSFRHFFISFVNTSIESNNGKNNKFIIIDEEGNILKTSYIPYLKVVFLGSNNTVIINFNCIFRLQTRLICSNNNLIEIKTNSFLNIKPCTKFNDGCILKIGKNTSIEDALLVLCDEPNLKIEIGDDCMISSGVCFRPSDGHTIIDAISGKVINKPQNIKIGSHVWVGKNCSILKGANIPPNSVIAANSVYTQSSNPKDEVLCGCIFTGIPAKIKKSDICWDRRNTLQYEQETAKDSSQIRMAVERVILFLQKNSLRKVA